VAHVLERGRRPVRNHRSNFTRRFRRLLSRTARNFPDKTNGRATSSEIWTGYWHRQRRWIVRPLWFDLMRPLAEEMERATTTASAPASRQARHHATASPSQALARIASSPRPGASHLTYFSRFHWSVLITRLPGSVALGCSGVLIVSSSPSKAK